jgi:hypothetical protein
VLSANFALCPVGRLNGGEKVKIVELAGVTGPETVWAPPIVAVKVSDENTLGSLTPIVTDEIVSVPELLLEMAKVPPATVEPGLPLPFPEEVTVTTAGVGTAVGVGATVGVAVGATVGVAVGATVAVAVGLGAAVVVAVGVGVGVAAAAANW